MFGVIINCITVILGSIIGISFHRFIPKKMTDGIMTGIGLCTLYIGFDGALKGENTLVLIISMALGAVIGYTLDIDGKINILSKVVTEKFSKNTDSSKAAQGFVTASLIFCVGAMTIVGSIQAGVSGDNTLLITKSILDLVSSIALSATFGFGVMLSAMFVFVFQGGLVLLSGLIEPYLTVTLQNEMICAGSVMIIGLGLNIIGVTKIKVANYLPAMIIAPLITPILNKFVELIG
jgi:uncharacterized membrane protein YqgA involved in biofilm formation